MSFIYLAPLFIYYPQFIPSVETQSFLIAGFAVFGLLFGKNSRAMYSFMLLMLLHILLTIFVTIQNENFSGWLRLLLLLVGPLILFGTIGLQALPPPRRWVAAVTIYFLIIGGVEFLFPNFYSLIALSVMDRANITDGHRGISFLTPEPTYAAISIVYFLILAWWSGKYWGFKYRWIEPALGLCLLATGSVYTMLLLLTLAIARWPRLIIMIGITAAYIVYISNTSQIVNDDSIRVLVVASRLLSVDSSKILESISYLDPSIGSRLATNVASFLAPYYFPLGLGVDCSAVPIVFHAVGFEFAFDNEVLSQQIEYGCIKPQSYVASIMIGFGMLSFIYGVLITGLIKYVICKDCRRIWFCPMILAAVMLVVQAQLTNPIPWLLIYFAYARYTERSLSYKGNLYANCKI